MLHKESILQLQNLVDVLEMIDDKAYYEPIDDIFNSTIGKHTRHIVEFYESFYKGYSKKILTYDKRKRSKKLETERTAAIKGVKKIMRKLKDLPHEKDLILKVSMKDESYFMPTTVAREMLYLLEHTTHHLALVRLGLANIRPNLKNIPEIGIAYSTPR